MTGFDKLDKQKYMILMAENLPVFRSKLEASQEDIALRIGVTRQTISAFESGQRKLTWSIFLALVLIFFRSNETKRLLVALEIYTPEFDEFINMEKEK